MKSEFSKNTIVPISLCDRNGVLTVSGCGILFMEIALQHTEILKNGMSALIPQNKFWVTVKTKMEFNFFPRLTQPITVETYPEKPKKLRCMRHYLIKQNGKTAVAAKTQWVIMNTKTGKIENPEGIYPPDLEFPEVSAVKTDFSAINADFPTEPFKTYTVKSTDIDAGRHMNNVAYIKAIESLFSSEEREGFIPASFEIIYKHPCFENDVIEFRKSNTKNGICLNASVNGTTIALALITRRQ